MTSRFRAHPSRSAHRTPDTPVTFAGSPETRRSCRRYSAVAHTPPRADRRLYRTAVRYLTYSIVLLIIASALAGISIGTWAYLFCAVDR